MTITNHAVGESINLASVLNTKLESPVKQSEMGLDAQATATKQAVRWDEFSLKHNNDGSFKSGVITNTDVSSTAGIQASKLVIQQLYKYSLQANPSVTASTYGTANTSTPPTGFLSFVPQAIDVLFGGTISSETVSGRITVTYNDSTTTNLVKTATSASTVSFTNSDIMSLIKNGTYIKQITVDCQSSKASSTANVTFNHYGICL